MADRHRFRAEWHDYDEGIYFVTICCHDRNYYFGNINDKEMICTNVGLIAERHIEELESHYDFVELWNHVVMPNHLHLVLKLNTPVDEKYSKRRDANKGALKNKLDGSKTDDDHFRSLLSIVVGNFKAGITRECNRLDIEFGWQERFHEHIIRNEKSLREIMEYVDHNVDKWDDDCFSLLSQG